MNVKVGLWMFVSTSMFISLFHGNGWTDLDVDSIGLIETTKATLYPS